MVECKAFGADRDGSPAADWNEVRKRLERNLVFENGVFAGRRPYAPWADREAPIRHYWFCTSGTFANPGAELTLHGAIEKFFNDVIGQRPGFEHLRGIDVKTRDWSDFTRILRDDPPLRYRWFRKLKSLGDTDLAKTIDPQALAEIEEESKKVEGNYKNPNY